ncbi:MAG: glycosyltransferase family 2 protein [Patescibacteria group bacterium]
MNLSVFFPAYNEEENIQKTVTDALSVLASLWEVEHYEVIIVDDGSQDQTGIISDHLAEEHSTVKVVHHDSNKGYGAALRTGFETAQYEWIAFTDSDGQFDFSEISRFIECSEKKPDTDLILGYKLKRADPFLRKLSSKLWGTLVKLLFGLDVKDRACGFKMIRKEVIDTIEPIETTGAVGEDELLIKAKQAGFAFSEVGVRHYPREKGDQTGANPKVIWNAFREIFYLWRKLH